MILFRASRNLKFCYFTTILLFLMNTKWIECTSIDTQIYPGVCKTEACKSIATEILGNMNHTENPCNNFYEYVCGNFVKNAVIPEGLSTIGSITSVRKKIENDLKVCVEEEITENDPKTFKILKSYYDTCMNEDSIESNSRKEFLEVLKQLGGWPILSGDSWVEANFDWRKTIQKFHRSGFSHDYFIDFGIDNNWKNNRHKILFLNQASLGVSQEFLSQGLDQAVVRAYYEYMVNVAEILGANRTRAMQELKKSLDFEIELAKISLSSSQLRDPHKTYNPMTLHEVQSKYPFVSWHKYLNDILFPYARLYSNEIVNVMVPSYFEKLGNLIEKTPKRVLANYAFWRVVMQSSESLDSHIRNAKMGFDSAVYGTDKYPRWQLCINHVRKRMPLAAGALYVRRRFDKKSKDSALEMINNLRKSFRQMLINADWMEDETKKLALDKLENMIPLVAYPDELLNDRKLDNFHMNMIVHSGSFLKTIRSSNLFSTKKNFMTLRRPSNRSDWTGVFGSAATANAFYTFQKNLILFPTGILQGKFFNADHPNYMNYAGIGVVVGHEMTHGFDDAGRQFDKDGNMVDWWDSKTAANYLNKADCMSKQYSNYTCHEVNLKVDGVHTLGENIADNGGIKEAYYAYKEWQRKNGQESRLPGLEAFTPEQMFWISRATTECSKYRPEYLINLIKTNPHTPVEYRIIGPMSNMVEFSKDFNCPLGSNMNPVKKCTIW